ncbi:Ammonium transporter 2 [Holothuria leucospilota]|uniref:Ammonium transporter 2 n=1 Tax=Holothuria leucospilota TaxID=206669 RepID=A0A9Q1GZI3_HOLLE|nr:Ammonium transporter 2 [Holothuria leucospilota]
MFAFVHSYITKKRKFDVSYIINGVLGALVSVTGALTCCDLWTRNPQYDIKSYCALARPWEALLMGSIGAIFACLSVPVIEKLKIDDPVGVIPVHVVSAVWGMLAVGLFGEVDNLENLLAFNGLFRGGGFRLLGVQLFVVVLVIVWSATLSFIILKAIDLTVGLRVPLHEELLGADLVEHSVKGSFEKETGKWFDLSGKLLLRIDETDEESYKNSIMQLRAILQMENNADQRLESRSAYGFRRQSRRRRYSEKANTDIDKENCVINSAHSNGKELQGPSIGDGTVSHSVHVKTHSSEEETQHNSVV